MIYSISKTKKSDSLLYKRRQGVAGLQKTTKKKAT